MTALSNWKDCTEPLWLISDFSTAFWSSIHSSFLFLSLGCLYMGTHSIVKYHVLLYCLWSLCLLFFRVPILTYRHFGTYSGLSRASDSEFWLYFAFKNPPKVCFLTIQLLSSAIIFNRVFSGFFFFFNSVSSQLLISRLWQRIWAFKNPSCW